jgi:hypothetical protein
MSHSSVVYKCKALSCVVCEHSSRVCSIVVGTMQCTTVGTAATYMTVCQLIDESSVSRCCMYSVCRVAQSKIGSSVPPW